MSGGPQERAGRAAALIAEADQRYYELDDPTLGDDEYDDLMRELRALEEANPQLVTPDSPTQRVSGRATDRFPQVRHVEPMLSLGNARGADEFRAWETRLHNRLKRLDISPSELRFVAEPKIDGIAISLLYENGEFVRGATRGDGVIGEDVTPNLKTIKAIPHTIDDAPEMIEVRGEIYFPRSGFAELNEQRASEGLSTFANPRNATAGTVRNLDVGVTASRPLSMWSYGIGGRRGIEFASHSEELELDARPRLRRQRRHQRARRRRRRRRALPVVGGAARVAGLRDRRGRREGRPDPAVARARRHRPRAALGGGLEVPADHRDDDAQPRSSGTSGGPGRLLPFAMLEPVHVGGVTVSTATLHNEEDLARRTCARATRSSSPAPAT